MSVGSQFYDGTKLLSLKDINGDTPELYLCTTNKSGGKTTYFTRLLINRFKQSKSKFAVLYRFNYELDDCAEKIFKDVQSLFFPEDTMTSERRSNGIYHELFLNEVPCGYAIAINSADQIKKMSHLFSDIDRMFFDEFQSETNHYCPNEVNKFRAIHTAVARGQHQHSRYVPVFMCANPVSIINPYYSALGISARLKKETRFLRGNGFVLEQGYVEEAATAQKNSAFNKAFGSDSYSAYQEQGVYLNDNEAFIEKPGGRCRYMATIRYGGKSYGIWEYQELGIVYASDKIDASFPLKITVSSNDHDVNYIMLKNNSYFLQILRYYFERGCFRFKDLSCKEAIISVLSLS